jgi:hypothetical protein
MPDFSTEIDIEPYEYISACSRRDIEHLIESLVEDGHLDKFNGKVRQSNNHNSTIDDEWKEGLSKLLYSKHLLSSEDEIVITNIIKKLV